MKNRIKILLIIIVLFPLGFLIRYINLNVFKDNNLLNNEMGHFLFVLMLLIVVAVLIFAILFFDQKDSSNWINKFDSVINEKNFNNKKYYYFI